MKLPSKFYTSDCGCGNSGGNLGYGGNSANIISDDRYLGLLATARIKLLGVKPGTSYQAFLDDTKRGFAFSDALGGFYVEDQPVLTLPTAAGGAYVLIASNGSPAAWKFLAAPETGDWTLGVKNGAFALLNAGGVPGVSTACSNNNLAASGSVLVCAPTGSNDTNGDPIYTVKKLAVANKRVLVGDTTGGATNYKPLPDADELTHPKASLPAMKFFTYTKVDASGATIGGGMDVRPNSGDGSVAELCVWSPTNQQFYKAPARTKLNYTFSGNIDANATGSFVAMAPHLYQASVVCNYPDLYVSFNLQVKNLATDNSADTTNKADYALYIDGALAYTWLVRGQEDITLGAVITGISIGTHTFEIRGKKASGTGKLTAYNSGLNIFSIV